ncbi:hypothetical protein Tco_1416059, partial [Tanacetum coccineum]
HHYSKPPNANNLYVTSCDVTLDDKDLISVDDTSRVLLVKLKDLDSASNMYIQFPSPEACENFRVNAIMINISSTIRTVTPSFKAPGVSISRRKLKIHHNLDEVLKDLNNDKDDTITSEEPRNVNIEDPQHKKETNTFDLSCLPGFKNFKRDSTRKCSTSFPRRRNKDIKGISFIHEILRLIKVGSSLGIDVRGYCRSLNQMMNGIGAQIVNK